MACSECGAAVLAAGQRYCHVCGALLPHGAGTTGAASPAMLYNRVGDGSDRAMGALSRQLTIEWLRSHKGRLVVYGGAAAVALVAAVAFLIAVVTVIIGFIAALAPLAVVMFAVYLLARPRRRRRRLSRIYRF